jgi:hypothetical protein
LYIVTAKNTQAVWEKIIFMSMHLPKAGDKGVMRGWNVYVGVDLFIVAPSMLLCTSADSNGNSGVFCHRIQNTQNTHNIPPSNATRHSRLFSYLIIKCIIDYMWLIAVYIEMNPGMLAKGYMPTLTPTPT